MEAIVVVGLAANILQFVTWTTELLSETHNIYTSFHGTTEELKDVEETTQDLADLAASLTTTESADTLQALPLASRPSKAEINLVRLASKCKVATDELIRRLDSLRLNDGPRSKSASFRLAFRASLGKRETAELKAKVDRYRQDPILHLIEVTGCVVAIMNSNTGREWKLMLYT